MADLVIKEEEVVAILENKIKEIIIGNYVGGKEVVDDYRKNLPERADDLVDGVFDQIQRSITDMAGAAVVELAGEILKNREERK